MLAGNLPDLQKSFFFHFNIQNYLHVVLQTLEQLPEESDWKKKQIS